MLKGELEVAARPVVGVQEHLPGQSNDRRNMEGTNAPVLVPNWRTATHNHVQVRIVIKLC